jgi:hypothetical protein
MKEKLWKSLIIAKDVWISKVNIIVIAINIFWGKKNWRHYFHTAPCTSSQWCYYERPTAIEYQIGIKLQGVSGLKVNTARCNSKSEMSYIHIHTGPIHNSYRAMNIYSKLNKLEKKEVHCVFVENSC